MAIENELYATARPGNIFITKDPDRVALAKFFDALLPYFEDISDHRLCLGYIKDIKKPPKEQGYHQQFFEWIPYLAYLERFGDIFEFVEAHREEDCYFAPLLYSQNSRTKQYALPGRVLWADLDDCQPQWLGKYNEPQPNIIVQSSAEHWQAYWLLNEVISAERIEQLNRNIVYGYRREGVDFGWSRTKIMRIPTTLNNKRIEPFKVEWYMVKGEWCKVSDFDGLPKAKNMSDVLRRVAFGRETIADIDADSLRISQRMKDLIKTGWRKGCGYDSRSEADMAVCCALVAAGYNDDEIKAVFVKYPIGAKYRGEPKDG